MSATSHTLSNNYFYFSRSISRSPIRNRSPERRVNDRARKEVSRRRSYSDDRTRDRSFSRGRRRSISRDRRRSRSPMSRGRSISRSRSRSRSRSLDDKFKPCVFYFSRDAKGCRFTGRECKFSHNEADFKKWKNEGTYLFYNTIFLGLI